MRNLKRKLLSIPLRSICIILPVILAVVIFSNWMRHTRLILDIQNRAAFSMDHKPYEMTQPIKYTVIEENGTTYTDPNSNYIVFFFQDGICVGKMSCGYQNGDFTSSFTYGGPKGIEEAAATASSVAFYTTQYGTFFYCDGHFEMMAGAFNRHDEGVALLTGPASKEIGFITLDLTHVE